MRKLYLLTTFMFVFVLSSAAQQPIKNIILLIGDGMGLAPVAMMQLENRYEKTIFDEAENIALTKTYSLDNRVTDSAASGTALATGHKTNNTYLGILPDGTHLESLCDAASHKGKATGVVVTTYLQHATPAAFYAHTTNRHEYRLISRQLAESSLDVAIGGGMEEFIKAYGSEEAAIAELNKRGFKVARTMEQLDGCTAERRTMALLADREVGADSGDYLARATEKAISLLDQRDNDNGFVLMVEGSLIDGMGHDNNAKAMQKEMQSFMLAVEAAVKYAGRTPGTLVVVTADHDTGGMAIVSNNSDFNLSEQGVEYRWTTDGHTAEMVPVYLYGTGAELINGIMENSELGAKLKELL